MIDVGKSEVRVRGSKEQESEVKEKEKISKILNARATVIMHIYICMVTVTLVHICTILHPLMWLFLFCQNV